MNIQVNKHQLERVVVKWLNKKYSNLTPKTIEKYPNSVFYVNSDNEVIVEYNNEIKRAYVNEIWGIIGSLFHLNSNDIQKIIAVWLKETYNLNLEGKASVFRSGIYDLANMEND
jgi:hypothetical protein